MIVHDIRESSSWVRHGYVKTGKRGSQPGIKAQERKCVPPKEEAETLTISATAAECVYKRQFCLIRAASLPVVEGEDITGRGR